MNYYYIFNYIISINILFNFIDFKYYLDYNNEHGDFMKNEIYKYVRTLLEVGCSIKERDSLIVYLDSTQSEVKNVLLSLKDEYKINEIVFLEYNYEYIYNLLLTNPSDEDIINNMVRFPKLKEQDKSKIKAIQFMNDNCDEYYIKLCNEIDNDLYNNYFDLCGKVNSDYDELDKKYQFIMTCWPTKSWANNLFGNPDKIDVLWKYFFKTVPNSKNFENEIKRLEYLKEFLNSLKIKSLYFYTDLGTDFKIDLNNYSIWKCEPSYFNGERIFYNFPSYEIYTSPDYNSGSGRVVLSKTCNFYCTNVNNCELVFNEGLLVNCKSDNEFFEDVIFYKENSLNRIGEIALVSSDSPIGSLNFNFNSLLLDENAGCHLALGDSIDNCIMIDRTLLDKYGKNYFGFNESEFHEDLVFGNSSICVEGTVNGRRRILMDKGKWTI